MTVADGAPGVTADVLLTSTAGIALDSSIVGNGGLSATPLTACAITFSRGPVATPGGNGCSDFQTTAAPMLAGAGDFHLLPGSPMVDAGNPAAPAPGALDLDGEARALFAGCAGTAPGRRDIGADEFAGTPPGCGPAAKKKQKKCKRKRKAKGKRADTSAKTKKKCKRKRKRKR